MPLLVVVLAACSSGSGNGNKTPPWFVTSGLNYTATYSKVTGNNCQAFGISSAESVPGFTVPSANQLVWPFVSNSTPQYTMSIVNTSINCGSYNNSLFFTNCNYNSQTNVFTAVVYANSCSANLSLSQTPVNNTFIQAGSYSGTIANATTGCSNYNINNGPQAVVVNNNPNYFSLSALSSAISSYFNNTNAVCMTLLTPTSTIQFTACTATASTFNAVLNVFPTRSTPNAPSCNASFSIP
jgi:hypothetical protein